MLGRSSKKDLTFVINTNIVISALVKKSYTYKLITSGLLRLYAPKIMIDEILEHIDEISERSGLTKIEVLFFLNILLEYIIVVDESVYADRIEDAYKICKKFDEKDTPFVALAMKLKIPIWSNDKGLKEKQDAVEVLTTLEISSLLTTKKKSGC